MSERPTLSDKLEAEIFLHYYYLKEELVTFCRENGLSAAGGKQEITKRIEHFLKTGKKITNPAVKVDNKHVAIGEISLNSIIEKNFVCSEIHRAFFKSVIGDKFSFNVTFQKYLKNNAGKTYNDAVDEWYKIQNDKKRNKGKSKIDSRFEYNTYIRDFFNNNSDKTLKEAIKCWKYKKSIAGHNRYERQDLVALND